MDIHKQVNQEGIYFPKEIWRKILDDVDHNDIAFIYLALFSGANPEKLEILERNLISNPFALSTWIKSARKIKDFNIKKKIRKQDDDFIVFFKKLIYKFENKFKKIENFEDCVHFGEFGKIILHIDKVISTYNENILIPRGLSSKKRLYKKIEAVNEMLSYYLFFTRKTHQAELLNPTNNSLFINDLKKISFILPLFSFMAFMFKYLDFDSFLIINIVLGPIIYILHKYSSNDHEKRLLEKDYFSFFNYIEKRIDQFKKLLDNLKKSIEDSSNLDFLVSIADSSQIRASQDLNFRMSGSNISQDDFF